MYLAILDAQGCELQISRIALYDVSFRLSPGQTPGDRCSFINVTPIHSSILSEYGRPAGLGLCEEPDSAPFAIVPLGVGRVMNPGESLIIAPGQLVLSLTDIRPSGNRVPDPNPQLRSRV